MCFHAHIAVCMCMYRSVYSLFIHCNVCGGGSSSASSLCMCVCGQMNYLFLKVGVFGEISVTILRVIALKAFFYYYLRLFEYRQPGCVYAGQ